MRYPEMVKTNARYRGPMESFKQSGQIRDAGRSIAMLYEMFAKIEEKRIAVATEIFTMYNETIPAVVQTSMHDVNAVKGGEL